MMSRHLPNEGSEDRNACACALSKAVGLGGRGVRQRSAEFRRQCGRNPEQRWTHFSYATSADPCLLNHTCGEETPGAVEELQAFCVRLQEQSLPLPEDCARFTA